ncbi:MAG TPA: hypothetical protein VIC27_06700 [Ktedonobacterales bacterium]
MIGPLAGSKRFRWALSGLALAGALALALTLGAPTPGAQAAPAMKGDSGSVALDIIQPAPSHGIAEGPVGANLLVQGTATAGDTLQIGIAPRATSCTTGFQPLNLSATAQSDGSFTASFAWPQLANNVGDRYYICAQDTTASAIGASNSLFQVDSASAPAISVTQVSDPNASTPGAGTPTVTPPNPPDGTFYAGGFIEITGQNFTPGGVSIQILATPGPLTPGTANAPTLTIVKGAGLTKSDGTFDVIAQLPTGQTGQFYISATSADGTTTVLPTLVGSQSAKIALAPTPTPSPSPSPSPKATASAGTGATPPPSGPSTGKVIGAIALGLFSAIFFILGAAMLISASGMGDAPQGRPQPR